jgi:hypothetical protein
MGGGSSFPNKVAGLVFLVVCIAAAHPPSASAIAPTCPAGDLLPGAEYRVEGSFDTSLQGSHVMLPFDVSAGTDAVRVRYCHDQPDVPSNPLLRHVLDLGLYQARSDPSDLWDEDEFRGWGGSSRPDVTVSPEGTIDPDPPPVGAQKTTVGFVPGPIPEGEWAAELGLAAIVPQSEGDFDGQVAWRVEIDLIDDPGFSDEPYQPVPYETAPAQSAPGWYAGDMHVHARHSNPGDATMRETFDYAFEPLPAGAGLDFITLSDYVTTRHWDEIGFFQPDYPGKLIIRSAEVITYRGHANNHASVNWADYRTGTIYERQGDGTLTPLRDPIPPGALSGIFDDVHAHGGFTQINHPTIFPSEVPGFEFFCRGCPWDYSDTETDYSKVDAIEIATGPAGLQQNPEPGPNPFTPLAIRFWEEGIDSGGTNANHIAAVGSSDSHNAGTPDDPITQSPIGQATTVVFASQLSEQGIQEGVEGGHTYVKVWGNDGPDLRLEATVPGSSDPPAIIGDTVQADELSFTATVKNLAQAMSARPGSYVLHVVRDSLPFVSVPIPPGQDEFVFPFESVGPARYRLQVDRTASGLASVEVVSSPIYHEPAAPPPDGSSPPSDGGGPPHDGAPISAGCGPATVGTRGRDRFRGTDSSDAFRAGRGRDLLRGRDGSDCLSGGGGRDVIQGGPGDDAVEGGRGADLLRGGQGDDFIDATDDSSGFDRVRCGPGNDKAIVDPEDTTGGCEHVVRR